MTRHTPNPLHEHSQPAALAVPNEQSGWRYILSLVFFEPHTSAKLESVIKLIFAAKIGLILPFVNLPSLLRISQDLDSAWDPATAGLLSQTWTSLLIGYVTVNLAGLLSSIRLKGSVSTIVVMLGLSIFLESSLSFFHSFLFDSGASLATALGPLSMAIVTYRLLLGYRFGLFQTILTLSLVITLYLGLTLGGWPSAPMLSTAQLPASFSVFDLNFMVGWYIWVALGSNFLANFIQGLRARLENAHAELQALNQYMTESVLKRYLPPSLIEEILAGRLSMDKEAESRTVTVMFTDLKGFTQTSETLGPERIATLLNHYLSQMNAIIFKHGGTIDKFIGDAVMVIFGAPAELPLEEQANRAVACALEMQAKMPSVAESWRALGASELSMRIGIHQGTAVVGNFGSNERSDYTCIGPTVNLASRIETVCRPGEVFVSPTIRYQLQEPERCLSAGNFELKGIDERIELFSVQPKA